MLVSIQNFLRGPYSLYDEEEHTVQQIQQPPKEKWLPGDRMNRTTHQITRAEHRNIVGIVDFLNRTGQGFSARGIPLYMFHPLHKGYPPMIVASKTNPKCNQLVKVNLEHWNEKWPRAGIQTVLGNVGSDVEQSAYLQSVAGTIPKPDAKEHPSPFCPHHKVYDDAFVFHIDPEGCQDVDDILSWREIPGGYAFAIGIADVSAWIPEDSETNTYAQTLGQTIYVEGKPMVPMLPNHISTELASMRSDGTQRPILAYVFTIQDGVCVSKQWEQQLVKVQRTYSYETILEDTPTANTLQTLLQIVYKDPISDDSHRWIEIAMILYNQAAAALLKEHAMGLLRSQPEGRSASEWQTLAQHTNCPELAFFGYGAGKYVQATESDVRHTGLDLDVYCHATSPLRRYADLYNQRCLHHILFQTERPKRIANWNHLNEQAKRIKHVEREVWFLQHLRTDTITEVEGFLLKQKKAKEDGWNVYVPLWKRTILAKCSRPNSDKPGEKPVNKPSDKVIIRAYTNLKAVSEHRIICSFV
jgi:exoribonuclease R